MHLQAAGGRLPRGRYRFGSELPRARHLRGGHHPLGPRPVTDDYRSGHGRSFGPQRGIEFLEFRLVINEVPVLTVKALIDGARECEHNQADREEERSTAETQWGRRLLRHAAVLSNARKRALRARGLVSFSASVAPSGRFVSTSKSGSRRRLCFTMRSSSEWKLMTTSRPPGSSIQPAAARTVSSAPSSSLT